jgi:hypothetical protein
MKRAGLVGFGLLGFGLGLLALLSLALLGCDSLSGRLPTAPQRRAKAPASGRDFVLVLADQLVTTLDLSAAEEVLGKRSGPEVNRVRARIAIYRGDCEGASARLSSGPSASAKGARELREYAEKCAGGTVGGHVIEDTERGIWIRLQDKSDQVLAPLLSQTAALARDAVERDLGTTLPRPLRLDLVRDLFTLSAVSGLPLEAAETTGTVAVARFGRVTMLSPRATRQGYPWQDTLAHEITHLVLSRASAENAPLWLQEGVAKREETRWRLPRAFDDSQAAERMAGDAQRSGRSVGLDQLGASIAMLPSADAATIAFAEVTSFVRYLLAQSGERALPALLLELHSLPDAERALRGVTGLGLLEWQVLWRAALAESPSPAPSGAAAAEESGLLSRRAARMSELLYLQGKYEAAAERSQIELDRAPGNPVLRFQAARALSRFDEGQVPEVLGPIDRVTGPYAGYLALASEHPGAPPGLAEQALGLDPFLIEVACVQPYPEDVPRKPELAALCEHVRSLPQRGSE